MDAVFDQALADFSQSFERARASGQRNFNAGYLATVDESGQPAARAVLLKGFDARGFVIFTDTGSRKARDLSTEPRAALCFYWEPLEEQARVEGVASVVDRSEVAADFQARPRAAQLMIWAARQSTPLESREALAARVDAEGARFPEAEAVPVPPHWGGFRLEPRRIEIWRGSRDRMHERFEYVAGESGWSRTRLNP